MAKTILGAIAAVLIALLAGFLWGLAGRSGAEDALERSLVRGDLLEARAAVLAARVAIYNTNFGDASRNLEDGRGFVDRGMQRLRMLGRDADAERLEGALMPIGEAQQLAGRLDLGANQRAAEALKTIESVLDATERP
jgi:hypothetical protein